jgi:hypothetical protein
MAYTENYTTAEVTILGITGILLINLFQKIKNKNTATRHPHAIYFSLWLELLWE